MLWKEICEEIMLSRDGPNFIWRLKSIRALSWPSVIFHEHSMYPLCFRVLLLCPLCLKWLLPSTTSPPGRILHIPATPSQMPLFICNFPFLLFYTWKLFYTYSQYLAHSSRYLVKFCLFVFWGFFFSLFLKIVKG